MYLPVKRVDPLDGYRLMLTFGDGEERMFDVAPYLGMGKFSELREASMLDSVTIRFDTIEWANYLDIDPEFLYEKSVRIERAKA